MYKKRQFQNITDEQDLWANLKEKLENDSMQVPQATLNHHKLRNSTTQ